MKTYDELLKAGESDKERADFCISAVNEFKSSEEYKNAKVGDSYYHKHNLTIEKFQKFLYTVTGRQVPDLFSANYKLKTLFFRRLVIQQVQYVLGNGLTLQNPENKDKLGKSFDHKLQELAKKAMAQGCAFGFWNLDHLEVFGFADTKKEPGFCPLYSEDTSLLMGGIRYWYRNDGKENVMHFTLYEPDGYTGYMKKGTKESEIVSPKRKYIKKTVMTDATGVEDVIGENYKGLPIFVLYANDTKESELVGHRESIDCYDFIKSGLANTIDDTSGFYWLLKNEGGMDDRDLAKFIQRIKTVKSAVLEDGQSLEAHTLDIPVEARSTMLEMLRSDIYEDFQALDVKSLSAAQKTTQEIQAAYQAQDNKCADFEYMLIEFIEKVLDFAGIDDTPTFVWNKVVNMAEQTSMILSCANFLSEETIIKHLPFLTPEEAELEIEKLAKREMEGLFCA